VSDFLDTDIKDLLNEKEAPAENEDEKAYRALQKQNRELMNGFTVTSRKRMNWPDPIRKRHIR